MEECNKTLQKEYIHPQPANKRMKMRYRYPYPWNLAFDVLTYPNMRYEDQTALYEVYIPKFMECVNQLNEREQKIIYYRYVELRTLQFCSEQINLTRERIRHIETKSIRKLKSRIKQYMIEPEKIRNLEISKEECEKQSLCKKPKKSAGLTIDYMGLSVRAYNVLRRERVKYIDDLKEMSVDDLKNMRGMGLQTLSEVIGKAGEFGIKFRLFI